MIAWRYLRAKRAEGGVSVMTWISLIGVTLAVFALIAVLSVRSGFRADFVDVILGANAHVTLYQSAEFNETGIVDRRIEDFDAMAERVRQVDGVVRVAPLVKRQVLGSGGERNTLIEVFGISHENLKTVPRVISPEESIGDLERFNEGIAIGWGIARELGVNVGDRMMVTSPNGATTPMGTIPRRNSYEVVYIFKTGRFDIDRVRVYMPFTEAQAFFNREGFADELEVMVEDPDSVGDRNDQLDRDPTHIVSQMIAAGGPRTLSWTWRDSSGAYLRALTVEDNMMFIIMAILVLIATMNIVSGLIMLVKNKGRDIGILRTMGLGEGSVLRVFFICGAFTGVIGTTFGVILGCIFAIYIEQIFLVVDYINFLFSGNRGLWDPEIRRLYTIPSKLELGDVLSAMALSLGLTFTVTIIPAWRAARMNPVEALRYE
nr:ABC transporter permease [Sulfitobacter algicola]